jgi:hypothetical protein
VTHTKRGVTAWLLVVGGLASCSAYLVGDKSPAHLELAPVFVGLALAVAMVRIFRSHSRRRRG